VREVTASRTITDTQGNATVVSTTFQIGSRLRVGMDAPNGSAWAQAVIDYPGVAYTRDFGTPTNLTAFGAGKWGALPAGAHMHVSWKGDVTQLGPWLSTINRPVYITWHHEPMGDVVPATYRATAGQITGIVDAHPNKHLVLGHGPIVTRYWLDENSGNPADWAYPGMTHYGIDCYMNVPSASVYYDNTKMFTTVFNKVRSAHPGIRLLVPEYGLSRITSDTTGAGRAAAIRNHINFLRTQPDVDAVAYFNNAVQFPQYAITPTSPEGQAWIEMQAA
jgi:hypothetical protein